MYTEEFILIPKRMFMSTQPAKSEIFDNPVYKQKATQLSLIQRNLFQKPEKSEKEDGAVQIEPSINVETVHEEKEESMSDDSEIEPIVKKSTTTTFQSIMRDLGVMEKNKIGRAEIILNKILESPTVSIEDPGGIIHIDNQPNGLKASTCLYNTQQSTKKIDIQKYSRALLALELSPHLCRIPMPNRSWKHLKAKKTFLQAHEENQEAVIKLSTKQKRAQGKRRQKTRPNSKNGLTSSEKKTLDQLYLKGPASFGNPTRLKTQSKLSFGKVRTCLETKPSFTKYRPIRLRFPRLKVIVKKINEIWSVDLAYVDKLGKYNRNVKYLLVAVDCLSRYLRVEPLKTKYATETASAFKKNDKKQATTKSVG